MGISLPQKAEPSAFARMSSDFSFLSLLNYESQNLCQSWNKAWGYFSRNVAEEGMGRSFWEKSILYLTHSKKYVEICEEREIEMKL